MNTLLRLKLALFAIGLILWFWGYRSDDSVFRIAGIAVLLVAFLLRFAGRRSRVSAASKDPPSAP
jgi:hypothetical protein